MHSNEHSVHPLKLCLLVESITYAAKIITVLLALKILSEIFSTLNQNARGEGSIYKNQPWMKFNLNLTFSIKCMLKC